MCVHVCVCVCVPVCLGVCSGVVQLVAPEAQLLSQLVLHHALVPHQRPTAQLVEGSVVERRHLEGRRAHRYQFGTSCY